MALGFRIDKLQLPFSCYKYAGPEHQRGLHLAAGGERGHQPALQYAGTTFGASFAQADKTTRAAIAGNTLANFILNLLKITAELQLHH